VQSSVGACAPPWVLEALHRGKQAPYSHPKVLVDSLISGFPLEPLMPNIVQWLGNQHTPLAIFLCKYLRGSIPLAGASSACDLFPAPPPWGLWSGSKPASRRRRKRISNKQRSLAWVVLQHGVLSLLSLGWERLPKLCKQPWVPPKAPASQSQELSSSLLLADLLRLSCVGDKPTGGRRSLGHALRTSVSQRVSPSTIPCTTSYNISHNYSTSLPIKKYITPSKAVSHVPFLNRGAIRGNVLRGHLAPLQQNPGRVTPETCNRQHLLYLPASNSLKRPEDIGERGSAYRPPSSLSPSSSVSVGVGPSEVTQNCRYYLGGFY